MVSLSNHARLACVAFCEACPEFAEGRDEAQRSIRTFYEAVKE